MAHSTTLRATDEIATICSSAPAARKYDREPRSTLR